MFGHASNTGKLKIIQKINVMNSRQVLGFLLYVFKVLMKKKFKQIKLDLNLIQITELTTVNNKKVYCLNVTN